MGNLYKRPDLLQPFQIKGLLDASKRLAGLVFDTPDEGHKSDMEAVENWAKELIWKAGLSGNLMRGAAKQLSAISLTILEAVGHKV